MGLIEDIRKMKESGLDDESINSALQQKGYSLAQIQESLSQTKIKEAVVSPPSSSTQEMDEMQPSMLTSSQYQQYQEEPPQFQQEQYPKDVQQYPEQQYQQYQERPFSSDMISEIAEQLIAEKISLLNEKLSSLADFKAMAESKLDSFEERIKKIEKIIDAIQLSILQKVGSSAQSIEDIKHELIETQKSFKAMLPELKREKPIHSQKQTSKFEE